MKILTVMANIPQVLQDHFYRYWEKLQEAKPSHSATKECFKAVHTLNRKKRVNKYSNTKKKKKSIREVKMPKLHKQTLLTYVSLV